MSVDLERIRKDISLMLKSDGEIRYVDIMADSLEDALSDAAVQLNTRENFLEYEIMEKGSNGFLGFMKKNWKIRVYEIAHAETTRKKFETGELSSVAEETEIIEIVDKDGEYFVHRFASSICLKVVPPIGNGNNVEFKEVLAHVKTADTMSADERRIKNAVENGTNGEYVEVGLFRHTASQDAQLIVDKSNDDMHAFATITGAGYGGADISAEQIKNTLTANGIVAGFNEETISNFVDSPNYGIPVEVASAILPVNGKNAYIKYLVETDRSKIKAKESSSGKIDYKERNTIQNVVAGQPIAQKVPAEKGKAGKTLSGRYIEAKNGKDIDIPLGQNVYVDEDGVTICAKISGQFLLMGDKISVEPLYVVEGDVGIKTGNISFLGSVFVKGSVEDGYDIKASGNIEINGNVGKSKIEADGNVIIQGIIMGRDEGYISVGKSMWAKSIQNVRVDVEQCVYVTDAIMNSEVTSKQKVFIDGKRAAVIGSRVCAIESVFTKNIGSPGGGSETTIEVGVDPVAKRRMIELQGEQSKLSKEIEEVDSNIDYLDNLKKARKKLPIDKEKQLEELNQRKKEIVEASEKISAELQQIQDHLRELKASGKISCSGTVYAGSKIIVRDVVDEIRAETKAVTFYWEGGFVKRGPYEAPDEAEAKRMPDGYTAN